jgi:hypothetical protein
MRKFQIVLLFALILSWCAASTAGAAEIIKPSKQEPNITVSSSETHKNLYVAGANVTVNGKTKGDLVAAGGMVSVIGDVEQEVMVAGGTVFLSGKIGSHARVAGGNITISGPIGGDLILGGGNVSVTEKSGIGGDLVAGVGNLTLDAPVKGNIKLAGGNVTINSKVDGSVEVFVGNSRNNRGTLIFGPQAEVLGKIVYKGPNKAIVKEGAKVGKIDYTPLAAGGRGVGKMLLALLTVGFLVKLIAWIIAGLLLARFKRSWLNKVYENLQAKPFASLGWGLTGLIMIPAVAILLFVTVVGYYLGFILGISFALLLVVANLVAALVLGNLVMTYLTRSKLNGFNWQAVVIGVVLYALLAFIPLFGWLIDFLLFLFALGAVLVTFKSHWHPDVQA